MQHARLQLGSGTNYRVVFNGGSFRKGVPIGVPAGGVWGQGGGFPVEHIFLWNIREKGRGAGDGGGWEPAKEPATQCARARL